MIFSLRTVKRATGVLGEEQKFLQEKTEETEGIRAQKAWDGLGKNQVIDWNSGRQSSRKLCDFKERVTVSALRRNRSSGILHSK